MTEETLYESIHARNRQAIASYLRRVADAFDTGEPVPMDESVDVTPPDDSALEVELEREDDEMSLEFEVAWTESGGDFGLAGDDAETAPGGLSGAAFELYRDKAEEWRWRLRHRNGNVIADSGEGYTKKANAVNGIESVKTNALEASIEEQD